MNAFPYRQQNVDISALVPIPASNDLNQSGVAIGLNDKYQFTSGALLGVVAQYMRFDSNAHGQGFEDMLITPQGYGGNYFNRWSRRGKEFQAVPSYQFAKKHWHGDHEIRIGADIDYRSFYGTNLADTIQVLRPDNSLTQQITFSAATSQAPSDSSIAEFVQDHWIISPNWSMDMGARLLLGNLRMVGRARAACRRGLFPGKIWKEDGNSRRSRNILWCPAAARCRFRRESQPHHQPIWHRWPAAGTGHHLHKHLCGQSNPLTSATLPGKPDSTPRNVTWNGEFSQELHKDLRLRVGYLDSHTTYLFDVEPFTSLTGGPSYMGLTNTGSAHYRELESTLHYDFRERDQVNFSYIWSQSRGDLNSISNVAIPFAAPVIRPDQYGILPSDIPNRIVAWGIFALPWKLTFSPLVDVHTGFPYSPIDVNQEYVGAPNSQRFRNIFPWI